MAWITAFLFGAIAVAGSVPIAKDRIGTKVQDFKLRDFRGAERSLGEFADQKAIVIAFLGTECPLAKLYGPRLAELADKYQGKKVAFIGVNSNCQDSAAEIGAFVRAAGIRFPVLKDAGNVIADRLAASRTPEVFLLDQERVVRYWGRIDDRYGIGYTREKKTHDYLEAAIDQLLAGQPIEVAAVESVGCYIGRVKAATGAADVTFSNQIARIFQDRCVECHRPGEIGPFSLSDYSEVAGWADTIAEVVKDGRMPPWHADPRFGHFRNARNLTAEEKELIQKWVAAGAPEGDRSQLPKPKSYVEGWSLPKSPDLVLDIHQQPFVVPAEGVVDYQHIIIDSGFTEDKWIKVSQILPGCPPVVHHVLCFVLPPAGRGRRFDENGLGFLTAYVPGYRPTPCREGMAKHVPAGSKLVFQFHYTPTGKRQEDRSKIGFVFAKPDEITHMVQTVSTANRGLNIPPHAEDYQRESTMGAYKHDLMVLGYSPHMHVRGKSFSYEAIFPDGKREMLLNVPKYDFNWQTNYELVEPKILPPGARVHCVAHWDNSENNPANPDPSQRVHWGDQTWDEMMIGFFDVALPVDRAKLLASGEVPKLEPASGPEERAKKLVAELDENGDGKLTRDELPGRFQAMFGFLDANHDGVVDVDEALEFVKSGPFRSRLFGNQGGGTKSGGDRAGRRRERGRQSTRTKDTPRT